jgi:ribulose-bisphosphate carboxylase small chain
MQLSFIVNRPRDEPGFELTRTEVEGRSLRYTIGSWAQQRAGIGAVEAPGAD